KLCDIEIIMRAYDNRVSESFFNPDDLLTQLEKTAELDSYISGKTVFIDSFRGFTAQEYNIIEHFIKNADDVYVTLCSYYEGNNYSSEYNITETFAKTKKTAGRLVDIAEKAGVPHAVPGSNRNIVFTGKEGRYISADLEHLEKSIALDSEEKFEGECNNIILCRAPDIYSECAFVAATAKKLLREKNLRCRDIAVIARKIDKYEKPLKSALRKCGIPVYEDFRKPVDASPVINTVSSALSSAAGNFDNDSMMRYIKSGLIGLDSEEASIIENYCFVWNIRGGKWLDEWKSNPDGFGEVKEQEEKALERINSIRNRIILPILELKKKTNGNINGEEAVKAVWEFIERINLRERVRDYAEKLISDGEEGAALELERMWDILIKCLDDLSILLKGETVNVKKLSESFEIMLRSQTIGNLPQGLDEIVIGSADRMRIIAPKIAFVIGANEGVFPPDAVLVSALTMKDRNRMAQFGIELSDSPEWKIADENLIAYSSLCCPGEFLAVTCSDSDADGSAMNPSPFYKNIKNIFPNIKECSAQELGHTYFTEGLQPAFEEFAKSENGEFRETVSDYFNDIPEFKGKIKALENVAEIRDFKIESESTAKELYGEFRLSASRIEKFYKCPFSYFCNYGLKLKKIDEASLDSSQIGNVTHKVLEELLKDPGVDELCKYSDSEIIKMISDHAESYIKKQTQDGIDSERFRYRFNVLKRVIYDILKRICDEFGQSEFRPSDFELKIGGDEIPAYVPEGAENDVSITGYIDRVDIAVSKRTGKKYFRVVDYKTGAKEFKLSDILHGINLQMLIYMFAL
ncbi:MAG: PD-(D/E)XK nuclease family protein, partial [Clostridia bacterium]|nr:PD-(D/E)XK nuclease family protein [Clostridia bacterium]